MDLSPRHVDDGDRIDSVPPAPRLRNRRKMVSIGLLVAVLAVGGLVVTKFLTSSLDYYCNVDEIGHKSGCEVGRRLRIQGTVDEGTLASSNGVTTFKITFNKVTKNVVYDGDPGGAFQECIPVVVHGVMQPDGTTFDGDEVEVKHTNEYRAKRGDQIEQETRLCKAAQPVSAP